MRAPPRTINDLGPHNCSSYALNSVNLTVPARWLARKYRCNIRSLLMKWFKQPEPHKAKTWVLFGKTDQGNLCGVPLFQLVGSPKLSFRWRLPESNPYLRTEIRNTVTSRYADVAMAVGRS